MININKMKKTNIPDICELQESVYLNSLNEDPKYFYNKLSEFPDGCFIINIEEELAGYIFSHPWSDDSVVPLNSLINIPSNPNAYYIHDLAISNKYRKIGLSKLLFNCIENVALKNKFKLIHLVSVQGTYEYWSNNGFISNNKNESISRYIKENYGIGNYMIKNL